MSATFPRFPFFVRPRGRQGQGHDLLLLLLHDPGFNGFFSFSFAWELLDSSRVDGCRNTVGPGLRITAEFVWPFFLLLWARLVMLFFILLFSFSFFDFSSFL